MPPVKKATTKAITKPKTKDTNMTTATATKTHEGLLKSQRTHADKYKGQGEKEGGRDYPATDLERLAGTIRLPAFEVRVAEAANAADQDEIDEAMEEYHLARLKVAQKRLDRGAQ